jgi:hypothetical protein
MCELVTDLNTFTEGEIFLKFDRFLRFSLKTFFERIPTIELFSLQLNYVELTIFITGIRNILGYHSYIYH